MSRSWLLSDKDIRGLVGPDMFGSISSRDRAIAKAQFRKLVEWEDQPCEEHGHNVFNSSNRRYCHWCQDDLRKEAGL